MRHTFEIKGSPAHVTLRWRFDSVKSVALGGKPIDLRLDSNGSYVEFDHAALSTVNWK